MPKLHLKRTPEEEAARRLRKKEKKAEKRRRRNDSSDRYDAKRHRTSSTSHNGRKWASDDEDDEIGPHPAGPSSSKDQHHSDSFYSEYYAHASKPDHEAIQAELEEQRFREKLSAAFDEDEAFDSLEARFNSFAHVPRHWGGHSSKPKPNYDSDEFLKLDPMSLDEEDYIEWVRRGMYRFVVTILPLKIALNRSTFSKTHAHEHEEQERLKSERASKRAREKAIKTETERLEKEAFNERKRKRDEKEYRRRRQFVQVYHDRWQQLLSTQPDPVPRIGFDDIPWPVFPARSTNLGVSLEDLSKDAISTFLFTPISTLGPEPENDKKDKREKLREAFLRFHPDKFESRLMHRVHQVEQEKVRTATAAVVRVLNDLMSEG
ncbi:hypothetical protein PQX77_002564 [Marasmius sp. AFHP31]|nr:hypothetical protein PQX77_002564 [Marasmius sp. AFHP31]